MYIDWSSVLIVIVTVVTIVGVVWLDEKVKECKLKKDSPFPLFKLTDEEGAVLSSIRSNTEGWENQYLCERLWDLGLGQSPLRLKIADSLGESYTLEGWRYKVRGIEEELTEDQAIGLRKQWIVALLEYNNMQEKLK